MMIDPILGMFGLEDCPACGVRVGDWDQHRKFHEALSQVVRKVLYAHLDDEEWNELREFTGIALANRDLDDAADKPNP